MKKIEMKIQERHGLTDTPILWTLVVSKLFLSESVSVLARNLSIENKLTFTLMSKKYYTKNGKLWNKEHYSYLKLNFISEQVRTI